MTDQLESARMRRLRAATCTDEGGLSKTELERIPLLIEKTLDELKAQSRKESGPV